MVGGTKTFESPRNEVKPGIFISYRRGHDSSLAVVAEIEAALALQGFRVLRDVDIEAGERWSDELWRWLMECAGAVAVVSDAAADSDWCRREWAVLAARQSQSGLRVVPVHVGTVGTQADVLDHLQAVVAGPGAADKVVQCFAGMPVMEATPADYLAAHAGWLDWLYTSAPALGREPFSLADVYMATECGVLRWSELSGDNSVDPFSEDDGGRHDLVDTVLGYLGDPTFHEPLVVQGPAGSGKSAFCLHLANRLMAEGLTPVLVRFRDLRLSSHDNVDELLQDAIRVAPKGEHPPPPLGALFTPASLAETARFGDATVCRTIVILDGWDEVALTGSSRFKSQVEEWLPRLRQRFSDQPGPPVRLLLTGRPSVDIDRSGVLRRQTPVLTIRPLRPEQLRDYAAAVSEQLVDGDWTLDLAHCEQAFARYAAWFNGDGDVGTDVLGSPLLALLAFRTVAEWPGDTDDLFERPTALYNALIEVTSAHAGKAEEGPEGTVHRGGRSLRRLLQRVAAVITCRGTESVSFTELASRLEDDDALLDWADQATNESTLHELVVNFYFKGHRELGCEFLHKSFREYLFAEAIVAELEAVSGGQQGPHPPPQKEWDEDFRSATPQHMASRSLGLLLSAQLLTTEVRTHAFWLIEQAATVDRLRWVWIRDLLADIYVWWCCRIHLRFHPERRRGREHWDSPLVLEWIEDQLPREGRSPRSSLSTFSRDRHLGRALLQLTAFVHGLLMDQSTVGARFCQTGVPGQVRFAPLNDDGAQIIARVGYAADGTFSLRDLYLGPVNLALRSLDGIDLSEADLRGADLNGASLKRADLFSTNLASADLGGAELQRANLVRADLRGASLRATNLRHADLDGAQLDDAVFNDAVLP